MTLEMTSARELALTRMPQQEGVWVPKDDWTGTIDRAERRKLQNRLNQRAYRANPFLKSIASQSALTISGSRKKLGRGLMGESPSHSQDAPPNSVVYRDGDGDRFVCMISPPQIYDMMRRYELMLLANYANNAPNLDHLVSLSKFNIQRAIVDNTHSMGMTMHWLERDDSISIFNISRPGGSVPELELLIPQSLRPTESQRRIPHHPWLDFFPFPKMRDNIIAVQDEIDDEDLCHDLMAFWDTRNTGATLLVWGSSWEPSNWEVTPSFIRKWGFLLRGCPELMRSTNYWRAQRGEKAIVWSSMGVPQGQPSNMML